MANDNVFFQFINKYWEDIVKFFDELYAAIKAYILSTEE